MAHFVQKAFQLAPNQLLYQQKRFRGKINLKKPKIFFKKAVLNDLLTPFFVDPKKDQTIEELCAAAIAPEPEKELEPYDKILVKDIRNWFDNSRMIACIHVNSISEEDLFDIRLPLKRANMYYKKYNPRLMREVVKDSPYEGLSPLFSMFTGWIFSPDLNVATLEKILKKSSKLHILGGVLDGYVMNCANFLTYGKRDLTTSQLGLVQLLQNAGGGNLNRQITHHQTTLVARLKQIGTDEEKTSNQNEQSVPT